MKAKRILAMLMAGALLLGTAAGCGSSGTTSSTSGGTDSTTTGGTTDNTDKVRGNEQVAPEVFSSLDLIVLRTTVRHKQPPL